MNARRLVESAIRALEAGGARDEAAAVHRLLARSTDHQGVAKLWELLLRWGATDRSFVDLGIGGITACVIPPYGVPPVEEIEQRDGWQIWLVGLGYPTQACATLEEAVQAALDERALIEEEVGA